MNESLADAGGGRAAITLERRLTGPPESVWRALTRAEDLAAWFPWRVEIDARPGGVLRFSFDGGGQPETTGTITSWEPPRLLAYTWGEDALRWEIRPEGAGCVLGLRHVVVDRPGAASFAAGWNHCLDTLEAQLAPTGRQAAPAPPWAVLHERFVAEFGLAEGEARETPEGWEVRFERQLTRPVADAWAALLGAAAPPAVGDHVPESFTLPSAPAGRVSATDGATHLAYPAGCGTVSWRLRDGTGGARLVLVQTGPAADPGARAAALAGWKERIEAFSAGLAVRAAGASSTVGAAG